MPAAAQTKSSRDDSTSETAEKEMSSNRPMFGRPRTSVILLAVVYALAATLCTWKVIVTTQRSTQAIEQILSTYNMKNEGERVFDDYTKQHPFLGMLFGSPVKHELGLPSRGTADHALSSDVTHLLKVVRLESSKAAWWSWFLLSLSLFYFVIVVTLDRCFTSRAVIFCLTSVSVGCFVIGVLAPAMVIWTAPTIPLESGNLNFVLQHQVRGIAAIIKELITTGHWIIGGFLLLFSIVTPLAKASLTFFVTGSQAKSLNYRIGELLHSIGKWSMADVFVAGILLSLYALKAQEATKSIPCLGLYYFIGYCMLSMTTTELLTHSGLVTGNEHKTINKKVGKPLVIGLFVTLFCYVSASSLYTYEQYTANMKQRITAPSSPQQLDNAHLVLPAHK